MKIIADNKLINRNARVSFWAAMLSPILIATSAWIFFNRPEDISWSLGLFIFGFILYQAGLIMKRWGRGIDQELNKTLKRLDDSYSLYHFTTPASHLLVGPAGIWILIPRFARGLITFNEKRKRWKLKRNTFFTKIFSVFLEGLGRPDVELIGEADALDRYLNKHWKHKDNPHIDAVLVFMDERTDIQVEGAPISTLKIGKLREFIRNKEQEKKISPKIIKKFNTFFKQD